MEGDAHNKENQLTPNNPKVEMNFISVSVSMSMIGLPIKTCNWIQKGDNKD